MLQQINSSFFQQSFLHLNQSDSSQWSCWDWERGTGASGVLTGKQTKLSPAVSCLARTALCHLMNWESQVKHVAPETTSNNFNFV